MTDKKKVDENANENEAVSKVEEIQDAVSTEVPAEPNLTVQDLLDVMNVIDLAYRSGAFGAKQAKSVSIVYEKVEKVVNFINNNQN